MHCLLISVFIWLFSLSVPFLYYLWNFIGYLMFFAHSAIFVGIVIMTIVQFRVTNFLKTRTKKITVTMAATAPSTSTAKQEKKELIFQKKITGVFMVMLGAFVGVYIPAVIMIYILHFCEKCGCTFRHVLRDLSFMLLCANSCFNPFIYAIRVKVFRKSLKALLCYRAVHPHGHTQSSVNTLNTVK